MAGINPNKDEIIRDPENYAEMIKKLEDRDAEALDRAKRKLGNEEAGEELLLQGAIKELDQLRDRRDFKALSTNEKERKLEPTDPHVLQVRDTVKALSHRIDTAITQDPAAQRALKGRITPGQPGRVVSTSQD